MTIHLHRLAQVMVWLRPEGPGKDQLESTKLIQLGWQTGTSIISLLSITGNLNTNIKWITRLFPFGLRGYSGSYNSECLSIAFLLITDKISLFFLSLLKNEGKERSLHAIMRTAPKAHQRANFDAIPFHQGASIGLFWVSIRRPLSSKLQPTYYIYTLVSGPII